jgi:hypothetical protein
MGVLKISCKSAKRKDLVYYLRRLGYRPRIIRGNEHWFLSLLREEQTPSFKVNHQFNIWYDHGISKGGNLVDFGFLYHKCSVPGLLQKFAEDPFFQRPLNPSLELEIEDQNCATERPEKILVEGLKKASQAAPVKKKNSPIKILFEGEIQDGFLLEYLDARKIPLDLAKEYCRQFHFELYGKKITALGWSIIYQDGSKLYAGHKDLNDWLIGKEQSQRQSHKINRHR